jgi:sorting and assembly machinery component 37
VGDVSSKTDDLGDASEEDQRNTEDAFVVGPGGTMAPRAWSGWRAGQEFEARRRQWGEDEVSE